MHAVAFILAAWHETKRRPRYTNSFTNASGNNSCEEVRDTYKMMGEYAWHLCCDMETHLQSVAGDS